MSVLNDSVNTPISREWKKLLVDTAGRVPGRPSHTKLMRQLCQWALPQIIHRLDSGEDVSGILDNTDSVVEASSR